MHMRVIEARNNAASCKSITLVASPASRRTSSDVPTLKIRLPYTAIASVSGCAGFSVQTCPLINTSVAYIWA
jgi:hypothetical protein